MKSNLRSDDVPAESRKPIRNCANVLLGSNSRRILPQTATHLVNSFTSSPITETKQVHKYSGTTRMIKKVTNESSILTRPVANSNTA
jgi:hypothetical protein